MKTTLLPALALVLLGASSAPVSLVAGAVRDQAGAPIAGAVVSVPGRKIVTSTGPDGTFALEAPGVTVVRIGCRFCRSVDVPVAADGTVVAIVRRYTALAARGPSRDDVAALPYAHVESDIALTPFVQLENSSTILPGPQLSDRGSQRGGGLVLDAGAPDYDVVANGSPFYTIPDRYVQAFSVAPQSDAYLYGDLADGGTFVLDPSSEGRDAAVTSGTDTAFRVAASTGVANVAAGFSRDEDERRQSVDASLLAPVADGTVGVDASFADGRYALDPRNAIWTSYGVLHASYERTRDVTVRADAFADRGTYREYSRGSPLSTEWSDAGASVTVRSNAAIAPFLTAAVRSSTGYYDAIPFGIARFGSSVAQQQITAGVHASTATLDVLAAFGVHGAQYDGGVYGLKFPASATMTAPVLRVRYAPDAHWALTASASGGFEIPTLLARYSIEPPGDAIYVDRDATTEGTLEWTDGARLRLAATALRRNVRGLDTGTIGAAGLSGTYQIAPDIAVRAWWMRSSPFATTAPGFRFGARPRPADTGSAWITYENPDALRVDAIWRQDLIDYLPDAHFDAAISGPLARDLRWFVGSERRYGERYTDVGLRFNPR